MFRPKSSSNTTSSSAQCKKHPKHKQSPGVCSLCLTQRLVKISSIGTRDVVARRVYSETSSYGSSQLSSSSDLSSDVSSCVSPRQIERCKAKKEKSRFWSRLLLRSKLFQGQLRVSHSQPLPITTTSSAPKVLAN